MLCTALLLTALAQTDIPWSSLSWGGPCPIHYPFHNETLSCKSVGRQRALVSLQLSRTVAVACADVSWRRRDDPAKVGLFVVGAADTTRFLNASLVSNASAIVGTVCFAPDGRSRSFAIYYYPFEYAFDGGSGSYHSRFLSPASQVGVGSRSAL